MPIQTATPDDLRRRIVYVAVPNTEPIVQIKCRRPQLMTLVAENWLPLEAYRRVIEGMANYQQIENAAEKEQYINGEAAKNPKLYDEFIDRWVCAAAIVPRFVLTEDDASAEAMWIAELDADIKMRVFAATCGSLTSKKARVLLEDFRRQQSAGDGTGPGGEAVPPTPVDAVTH